jgi:glucan phosphoethanolaminetransferase (alkaline phosphatase superfamily)
VWKRLIAPVLSFLGLGTALFFIVTNFTVLFGSAAVAWVMALSAPVVFLFGTVFATFVQEFDDRIITRNMDRRM